MHSLLLSLCILLPNALPVSKRQAKMVCRYEKTIFKEAARRNVDPYLLTSLIYVESAFRSRVVSHAGACGLTQVIPKWTGGRETAYTSYTCSQLKNPITAIKVGAQILSYVTRKYAKGNIDKGLCYYNAGTKCVTRKNFYKKSKYVKKVNQIWRQLTDGC